MAESKAATSSEDDSGANDEARIFQELKPVLLKSWITFFVVAMIIDHFFPHTRPLFEGPDWGPVGTRLMSLAFIVCTLVLPFLLNRKGHVHSIGKAEYARRKRFLAHLRKGSAPAMDIWDLDSLTTFMLEKKHLAGEGIPARLRPYIEMYEKQKGQISTAHDGEGRKGR
ncbi:hypothetical protein COY28_02640 [Candidatus Woesearchaeota archaeon CG_4_10_14_0_2_um_filter_57_5]|nr:MAG: hypothetical protein AUJ68_01395 [Candidatus Woesearchaeota archaeon CG1_02_57_44]PIN67899.1 MAG: hypothetical protein COV94_06530 [Candidatus Woesearchaeota archaeon CG11_big_fil_rev_8_21_14_0_20_57_5]PIZ54471.1 MAG: hypothetical protein COY28_02640 [Candidatus Woesearchaeota archaeon CG_4_10_14_0_2_um_filter_57_5]